MLSERLRTFVAAVAAIAAVFFFGGSRAEAALEIVATTGGTTDVFYSSSSTTAVTPSFTIGGYSSQVDTTFTNYPGSPALGSISTTLNFASVTSGSPPLTVSVMVIGDVPALDPTTGTGPLTGANLTAVSGTSLLAWTAPSSSPVTVTANTSTSSQQSYTGSTGSAATTSYYDSPPITGQPRTTETGGPTPGTPVVTSGSLPLNVSPSPNVLATTLALNSGTYSLSQSITVTDASSTAPFNVTGTSTVNAVPEPSSMAIAGIGALSMIGYGLRRRKALGA